MPTGSLSRITTILPILFFSIVLMTCAIVWFSFTVITSLVIRSETFHLPFNLSVYTFIKSVFVIIPARPSSSTIGIEPTLFFIRSSIAVCISSFGPAVIGSLLMILLMDILSMGLLFHFGPLPFNLRVKSFSVTIPTGFPSALTTTTLLIPCESIRFLA